MLVYTFRCMKNQGAPPQIPFQFLSKLNSTRKKKMTVFDSKEEFKGFILLRKPTNKFSPLLIPMALGKLGYSFHLTNAIFTRRGPLRRGQNSNFL